MQLNSFLCVSSFYFMCEVFSFFFLNYAVNDHGAMEWSSCIGTTQS